jgi:hypothetical protein
VIYRVCFYNASGASFTAASNADFLCASQMTLAISRPSGMSYSVLFLGESRCNAQVTLEIFIGQPFSLCNLSLFLRGYAYEKFPSAPWRDYKPK